MRLAALLITIAMSVLSACTFLKPRDPFASLTPLSAVEKETFLSTLREEATQIKTFRSLFQGSAKKALGRQNFKQSVVFERPDKLRIEYFIGGLNQLVAIIVAGDGSITFGDMQSKEAQVGNSSPASISRLVGVPFSAEELMLWLTGRVLIPTGDELASADMFRDPKGGGKTLRLVTKDGRTLVAAFEPGYSHLLRSADVYLASSRTPVFHSQFEYSERQRTDCGTNVSTLPLPQSVQLEIPEKSVSLRLTYDCPELNIALPDGRANEKDELFSLDLSQFLQTYDLTSESAPPVTTPLD